MRPARKTAGALTTAASFETAVDAGGTIGACFAGPRPTSVARSHVGNGAVKGARIKTTSQPATNRGSIDGSAIWQSKLHATRQPSYLQFSRENPGKMRSETRPKCMGSSAMRHYCRTPLFRTNRGSRDDRRVNPIAVLVRARFGDLRSCAGRKVAAEVQDLRSEGNDHDAAFNNDL